MIPGSFIGLMIVLYLVILAILLLILVRLFCKTTENKECSYCKGELSNCKITVTNDCGTNIYCDPYCLGQGLKYGKNKKIT
jgi:hypothetical protein